ncbi:MAG: lactate utilization protein B/C, partial [Flavobacterium sp.]
KKYDKDYPTNITTIKYFEKAKEEDFMQYGSAPKNLYLLLLEDL